MFSDNLRKNNCCVLIEVVESLKFKYLGTLIQAVAMDEMDNRCLMQYLIDNGADVNAKNYYGFTPLHCAVLHRNHCVIDLLIQAGANINAKSCLKRTALHFAISNYESKKYKRTLQLDSEGSDMWMVEKLLDQQDILVNLRDVRGDTPLMWAVMDKQLDAIFALLRRKANPNIPNKDSLTPLHVAMSAEDPCSYIVVALLFHQASINITDKEGNSAIDILIQNVRNTQSYKFAYDCLETIAFTHRIKKYQKQKLEIIPELSSFLKDCSIEVMLMKMDYVANGLSVFRFMLLGADDSDFENPLLEVYLPIVKRLLSWSYPKYLHLILEHIPKSILCIIYGLINFSKKRGKMWDIGSSESVSNNSSDISKNEDLKCIFDDDGCEDKSEIDDYKEISESDGCVEISDNHGCEETSENSSCDKTSENPNFDEISDNEDSEKVAYGDFKKARYNASSKEASSNSFCFEVSDNSCCEKVSDSSCCGEAYNAEFEEKSNKTGCQEASDDEFEEQFNDVAYELQSNNAGCGLGYTDSSCEEASTDASCEKLSTDASCGELSTDASCGELSTDASCEKLSTDASCEKLSTDASCEKLSTDAGYEEAPDNVCKMTCDFDRSNEAAGIDGNQGKLNSVGFVEILDNDSEVTLHNVYEETPNKGVCIEPLDFEGCRGVECSELDPRYFFSKIDIFLFSKYLSRLDIFCLIVALSKGNIHECMQLICFRDKK